MGWFEQAQPLKEPPKLVAKVPDFACIVPAGSAEEQRLAGFGAFERSQKQLIELESLKRTWRRQRKVNDSWSPQIALADSRSPSTSTRNPGYLGWDFSASIIVREAHSLGEINRYPLLKKKLPRGMPAQPPRTSGSR